MMTFRPKTTCPFLADPRTPTVNRLADKEIMNPVHLPSPAQTIHLHKALCRSSAPPGLGVFGYHRRLCLYAIVLYASMVLELGAVLVLYSKESSQAMLTAQLGILLVLLVTTAGLFVLSLLASNYWVKTGAQGLSFLITTAGYLLLDSHFLPRIVDVQMGENMLNALVPIAVLAALLPTVLMYNWKAYAGVISIAVAVILGLRAGGEQWEIGLLEAGIVVIWAFPAIWLLSQAEFSLKSLFSLQSPEPEPEFSPPKRSKTLSFAPRSTVIGTELEDILTQLDKLQVLIHGTEVHGGEDQKQWAEATLQEIMEKLATGRNIYQGNVQNTAVDPDDLAFLEQNYLPKQVEVGIVHMSSVPQSLSGTQSDIATQYSVSELLPVLQKLGNNWNFDVFFVSQCTDNHSLQTCAEYIIKKFQFSALLSIPETTFHAFFDSLASVNPM